MHRFFPVGLLVASFAVAGFGPAAVAAKKSEKTAKVPEAAVKDDKAGGKLIEAFGDWTASLAAGKAKTCYALAKPKQRIPDGKRDAAYVFIADRPAEKVRSEVSVMMGFPVKEGSAGKAKVGKTEYDLVAVSNAFFMKDPADDARVVEGMKRGGVLTVKASPLKGALTTDIYSLNGFKPAIERAQKECR